MIIADKKGNIKMVVGSLCMVIIGLIIGLTLNSKKVETIENNIDTLEVKRILTVDNFTREQMEDENIYIEKGDTFIEFNDNSYSIINPSQNLYSFQPIELLDWDYQVDNMEQLKNLIASYKECKYDYFKE